MVATLVNDPLVHDPSSSPGEDKEIGEEMPLDDQAFYLYLKKPSLNPHESGRDIPEGPFRHFAALLKDGTISLVRRPTAGKPAGFQSTDDWFCWFASSIYATALSVTVDDKDVFGFGVVLNPTNSHPIHFTTTYMGDALGLPLLDLKDPSTLPAGLLGEGITSGLLGKGETLILGLDPDSSPLEMTIQEAFAFAELHEYAESPPVALLGAIKLTLKAEESSGRRNAIWFEPGKSYKTVVRLQLSVDVTGINDFFAKFLNDNFAATAAYVVIKRVLWAVREPDNTYIFQSQGNVELIADCKLELENATVQFSVALSFQLGSLQLTLVPLSAGVFKKILIWLAKIAGLDNLGDLEGWLKATEENLGIGAPEVRRIKLVIAVGEEKPTLVYFSMDMSLKFKEALFVFTYSWYKSSGLGKLKAILWARSPFSEAALLRKKVLPDWERYREFSASDDGGGCTPQTLSSLFSHKQLTHDLPAELGRDISHLALEISDTRMSLYGTLVFDKPAEGLSLDVIDFAGQYIWNDPGAFELSFMVRCMMQESEDSTPTILIGKVQRSNKKWTLSASLRDLTISTLYQFLDVTSRNEAVTFLGRLEIVSLSLTYTFPDEFTSKGKLRLGGLELDLEFKRDKSKWSFTAKLDTASKQESTIGPILASITGSEIQLPSFISDISVGGCSERDIVTIVCNSKKETGLFFAAVFHIGPLKFTFVQYRGGESGAPIKRLIKVAVRPLPLTIPMIGDIPQPFGEMFYMWVQAPAGFTEKEVRVINDQIPGGRDKLVFKRTAKDDNAAVITAGSHFVVVADDNETVVIDYVSQKPGEHTEPRVPTKEPEEEKKREGTVDRKPAVSPGNKGEEKETLPKDTGTSDSPDASMAAYKKSIGPLSISHIGLKFDGKVLRVLLDAELLVGPIGLTLIGLTVDIELGGDFNLQNISLASIKVAISGMAVSFDQSPIEIAGTFRHIEDKAMGEDSYEGGLIVGFEPYRFSAAGFYKKITGNQDYKSVFVFGKLEGPLIVLEFAVISGITGGFGYNVDLTRPNAAEILDFPFLAPDISPNPQQALTKMLGDKFLKPCEGSFWIAAGLQVCAFQALTIDAVVVVGWNPYINLGLFGLAVVDVPKIGGTGRKFLHVELGIAATIDFRTGAMKLEGQLTPNSFILSPSCHLTGGFALYYWFPTDDSDPELEGDWVFTIGGYHRSFQRPLHYPNPPRLAISWKVDKSISVTGEAYFAITPKVCMGGGRLHAALSLGPLDAHFDAYADFLINFEPFHFTADVGVSVGVSYNLDVWFTSIHIGVEIGAQLHLVGPPFSGTLHVDFWVFGFDINFGEGPAEVLPVTLERFYQLVIQTALPAPGENHHVLACQSGMITDKPATAADTHLSEEASEDEAVKPSSGWKVRGGGFSFRIARRVPIDSAVINLKETDPLPKPFQGLPAIYAKPMKLTSPLESAMEVTIKRGDHPVEGEWDMEIVERKVPSALWGIYSRDDDPMEKANPTSLLDGGAVSIRHAMGIVISAPSVTTFKEVIQAFNPALQRPSDPFFGQEPRHFPPMEEASLCWLPADPLQGRPQWKAVQETWKAGLNQQETVDDWAQAFSWKSILKAEVPTLLMEDFEESYLAPPMLTTPV